MKEPTGNPSATGIQGSGDSPEDTMGTGDTDGRETATRDWNGHRALLMHGQTEDEEEERGPPERQRALNLCNHQVLH